MKKDSDKKNKKISAEDQRLWAFATQDVAPIKSSDEVCEEGTINVDGAADTKDVSAALSPQIHSPNPLDYAGRGKKKHNEAEKREHNLYNHADVDRKSFDKFRKGQMPIEATLDLHGCNRQQAYEKVSQFITRNAAMGLRCVMIITGKGKKNNQGERREEGILKQSLPDWLELPDLKGKILKVQQAQRFHGGSGAYYVLLRRNK